MIRTQVSLTEEQMVGLRELAHARGEPIARSCDAVDAVLAHAPLSHRDRARAAAHRHRSGDPSDVSVRHDELLEDAFDD